VNKTIYLFKYTFIGQSQSTSSCPQQQQQQQQFKSHLVQALTQNSLLINSTKEMRQAKNQQQGPPQPTRQSQSSTTPTINTQQLSRKRPHSQINEGECSQSQASTFPSLLSPSLANFQQQQGFLNNQSSDSLLYNPSNPSLLSPTLLNSYIQ